MRIDPDDLRARVCRLYCIFISLLFATTGFAQTGPVQVTTPDVINVAGATQVSAGGQTYINSGIVGMGRVAAGTRDFNNDAIGAFSGMDINLKTWRKTAAGYTGTLFGLPDRGPNGIGSVNFSDYAGRLKAYSMTFKPYTGALGVFSAALQEQRASGRLHGEERRRVKIAFWPPPGRPPSLLVVQHAAGVHLDAAVHDTSGPPAT